MTRREWSTVLADVYARWPHATIPDESADAWFVDVEDLDVAQVAAAVMALARDGREFAPNGAQIRRKVIELGVDRPDWAAVFSELRSLVSRGYCYPHAQGGPDKEEREKMLLARDPITAAFARWLGADQLREGLTGDGGDEARLREKWHAFIGRAERELAYRGLPAAGLPQLERIEAQRRAPRELGSAIEDARALLEPAE